MKHKPVKSPEGGLALAVLTSLMLLVFVFGSALVSDNAGKAPESEPLFVDISDSFAKEEITSLCRAGILSGFVFDGESYFCPKSPLSRAEFAAFTVKLLGLDAGLYSDYPLDISDAALLPEWAVPYIKTVLSSSLMSLSGDGFDSAGTMTREEAIFTLGKLLVPRFDIEKESLYPDLASVSPERSTAFRTMLASGIVIGYPDGLLHPEFEITREEFALILYRMAKAPQSIFLSQKQS